MDIHLQLTSISNKQLSLMLAVEKMQCVTASPEAVVKAAKAFSSFLDKNTQHLNTSCIEQEADQDHL